MVGLGPLGLQILSHFWNTPKPKTSHVWRYEKTTMNGKTGEYDWNIM